MAKWYLCFEAKYPPIRPFPQEPKHKSKIISNDFSISMTIWSKINKYKTAKYNLFHFVFEIAFERKKTHCLFINISSAFLKLNFLISDFSIFDFDIDRTVEDRLEKVGNILIKIANQRIEVLRKYCKRNFCETSTLLLAGSTNEKKTILDFQALFFGLV